MYHSSYQKFNLFLKILELNLIVMSQEERLTDHESLLLKERWTLYKAILNVNSSEFITTKFLSRINYMVKLLIYSSFIPAQPPLVPGTPNCTPMNFGKDQQSTYNISTNLCGTSTRIDCMFIITIEPCTMLGRMTISKIIYIFV